MHSTTPPLSPQHLARRQQLLDRLTATSLRAMTADPRLDFGHHQLRLRPGQHDETQPPRLASPDLPPWLPLHLYPQPRDGLQAHRAVANGLALRLLLTDPVIHARYAPPISQNSNQPASGSSESSGASDALGKPDTQPEPPLPGNGHHQHGNQHRRDHQENPGNLARVLYEWFEQLRVESLVPPHWPGVKRSLLQHFERWTLAWHDSGQIETQLGLLLFSVGQMVWSRMQRRAPPEAVIDTMEATRAGLSPVLGDALYQMARHREQPALFSPASARLATTVAALAEEARQQAQQMPPNRMPRQGNFVLPLQALAAGEPPLPLAPSGQSRSWISQQQRYRVFTREFDQQILASTQVRNAQLHEYRAQLDTRLRALSPPVGALARQLQRTLSQPLRDGWLFQRESGRIDARRLAALVANPLSQDIFRLEAEPPVVDASMCLLLDCSGSMKAHAETLALFADIWLRICQRLLLPLDVLGFSTGAWHGGRALKRWRARGMPPQPGRLAERLHLVYKSADMRGARARLSLAALLKPDLYREGLDGEAVQWATQRLQGSGASRKILLVVSDGSPMETATRDAQDAFYLDNHLKACVQQAQASSVDVVGIGVGLDLSPFYPRHVPLPPEELLDAASFRKIIGQLTPHP